MGRKFLLHTDHGSLAWLWNFKKPEGQLAHWLERLQEYNFKICHRPDQKHQNADALSRGPCKQCGREKHNNEDSPPQELIIAAMEEAATPVLVERTSEELHQLQCNYGPTGLIVKCLEKEVKPKAEDVRQQGPEAQRLTQLWNRLVLEEGVLKRKYDDTTSGCTIVQLVVPPPLREEVLKELHAGALEGHLGEEKTLIRPKRDYTGQGCSEMSRTYARHLCYQEEHPKEKSCPFGDH